ncbi:hypothetical protein L2E82_46514 [Cichorium intybus]|uniref:Uncharacterized protein n=1 Tax=Cichorium intybus TaxID=13427 RepID=A0ACB8YUH8_CICIN|nr:hypothetical protein L2E82_46514 [Cichorium intybus]
MKKAELNFPTALPTDWLILGSTSNRGAFMFISYLSTYKASCFRLIYQNFGVPASHIRNYETDDEELILPPPDSHRHNYTYDNFHDSHPFFVASVFSGSNLYNLLNHRTSQTI